MLTDANVVLLKIALLGVAFTLLSLWIRQRLL
jgi:hypothetical protein